jgi:hypothetical protein
MASSLRSFSSARHGVLAISGIDASTRDPADKIIYSQNLPTTCVCDDLLLLLFCSTLFYFACSEGHSAFDPGGSPLSAGTSHTANAIFT